ncbi:MAG TPA: response regulator, partial [Armatimonadota bacterium]|nr:response regulator [Armatimonadota bacterium]
PDGGEIGIDVTGNRETTTVEFTVWDHGIGISHERIRELFQPFVQLDNRLSRKYSGTGLGLSLVQRMAELHGGSVSVESNIGTGSRFSILLPWDMPRQYSTEPIKPHKPAKLSTAEKPAYSSRILVAEDNAAIRNLLVDFLSKRGYCVTTAINGEEAVAVTVAEHPDVILMDIQMPDLDGLAAIRLLRKKPESVDTPIIALTALVTPNDREQCLEAGANEYMRKPVSLELLERTIVTFLQEKCISHTDADLTRV